MLLFLQVLHDCLVDQFPDHLLLHLGLVFIDQLALQEALLADVPLVELLQFFDEEQQLQVVLLLLGKAHLLEDLEEDGVEHLEPVKRILFEEGEAFEEAVAAIGLVAILLCSIFDDLLDELQLLLKLLYEYLESSLQLLLLQQNRSQVVLNHLFIF